MRKKNYYCMLYGEKIEEYLKKHKIKYKIVDGGNYTHNFICFTVYDSAKLPDFPRLIYSKPDVSNEFTQQELLEADYLTMEPIIPAIDVENGHEAYENKCPKKNIFGTVVFAHKKQVSPYRIKKYYPKGKTTFYTNSVGFRDIFAKKEAGNLMQENNITGLQIRSVMSGTKKTEIDDKICQLSTNNIIPTDRIYIDKKIKIKRCSVCGAIKLICSSDYQLELMVTSKELTDDFYMTDFIFGEGLSSPMYIISNRLYRLLLENKMTYNVIFQPVIFRNDKLI